MNGVVFLAVIVAAFGSSLAQQPPNYCRTCEIIMNIARHHFNNTVNDKAALLTQLQMECARVAQFEGAAAAAHCNQTVNNNIDTIYNDLHTDKSVMQTCMDIGECMMTTTMKPERAKRQAPHNPCRTCEIIIGIAKRHFNNNFTDQGALKTQLDMECQNLVNHQYTQQEADNCQKLVDDNIAAIFMELKNNPNANPMKVCQDLQQCQTRASVRAKRQHPHDPCRTCEFLINIAYHHFNNKVTDQNALQQQLLMECDHLGDIEGQEVAAHCTILVNSNIEKIYVDMWGMDSSRQTCYDVKECPQPQ